MNFFNDLLRLRKRARHVDQTRTQTHRAVLHRLIHDLPHARKLLRIRGPDEGAAHRNHVIIRVWRKNDDALGVDRIERSTAITGVLGVIGLGSMGYGAAVSAMKRGVATFGLDSSAAARERFVAAGGQLAASLQELAARCDVVQVLVVNAALPVTDEAGFVLSAVFLLRHWRQTRHPQKLPR